MQTGALNAAPVLHSGDQGVYSRTSGVLCWRRFSVAFLSSVLMLRSTFKHYVNAFFHILSKTFTVALLFNAVESLQMGEKDVEQVVAIGHVHTCKFRGRAFTAIMHLTSIREVPCSTTDRQWYISQFTRINSGNTTLQSSRPLPSNIFKFKVWKSAYTINNWI
jgi:hypothetical protein